MHGKEHQQRANKMTIRIYDQMTIHAGLFIRTTALMHCTARGKYAGTLTKSQFVFGVINVCGCCHHCDCVCAIFKFVVVIIAFFDHSFITNENSLI